ncbi:MAG: hypothetical protein OEW65_02850 [Thermoleophilia bacterium]|nr:hypothetical protein [Thermoleophilia bacterium]
MARGDWDLDDYRDLLDAAGAGGYRFALFDVEPEEGLLFLRHDVDLTLHAALVMARLEAELGIATTYLLMTESLFYNLASPEGTETIEELRQLGHRVGLHAVYPNVELDDRFDRVVAWHNPEPAYMTQPIAGALNVMGEPYFDPQVYRSDSNQHWRRGDPREELRAGSFPWLQLLIHPAIWVYPGATMGETMRAMLEAERERRLGQLPGDRITMG